jgi:hypothetical protein
LSAERIPPSMNPRSHEYERESISLPVSQAIGQDRIASPRPSREVHPPLFFLGASTSSECRNTPA